MKIKTSAILILFFSLNGIFAQISSLVNPFIGTGGHGHTFPGPVCPFGMVQLSPDTRIEGWDGCSGYHYSDSLIYGFSHLHLSGTGVPDYCDILVSPGVEAITEETDLDQLKTTSIFRKKTEKASAGYYEVFLEDCKVKVQLTASLRTGIHQYTFPKKNDNWILINLKHRDKVIRARFSTTNKNEVSGFRISKGWAKEQHVYFNLRTSAEIDHFIWSKDSLKLLCFFKKINKNKLIVQCGISAVDEKGAKNNIEGESCNGQFNKALKDCKKLWNEALSRIEVKDHRKEKQDQLITFYTALYHSLIHPSLYQDIDNRYRGMDNKIKNGDAKFPRHTVFSLWDTYRAAHPMYQLIYPEKNLTFAKNFLGQYKECGRLPVWELSANETYCMIGNHSIPVLANAYLAQKKNGLLSKNEVIKAIEGTFEKNYSNISAYKNGFISIKDASESVSKTLENSLDYGAYSLVKNSKVKESYYYKNLFNPQTGFFQAKTTNRFIDFFDPSEVNSNYTEANAWQYLFGAHHDIEGIMECLNIGKTTKVTNKIIPGNTLEAKLDSLFETSSQLSGRDQSDITGLIGQYAHGNEPSHHVAYLYNYCNRHDKTEQRVQEIIDRLYSNSPEGLCGNEDCGQMSAWYVFSCLGFYPVNPITGKYQIGIPQFEKVQIKLPNQKPIVIKCLNLKNAKYLEKLNINGIDQRKEIEIKPGDELNFNFSSTDYLKLDPPMSSSNFYTPMPYISYGKEVFIDSTHVILSNLNKNEIEYYFDTIESATIPFSEELIIDKAKTLFFKNKNSTDEFLHTNFIKSPTGFQHRLLTNYEKQYNAGGQDALFNGVDGSLDFRDGNWQGFLGKDVEIELQTQKKIKSIRIRCLQDQSSWILFPSEIELLGSMDGINYNLIEKMTHDIEKNTEKSVDHVFITKDEKIPNKVKLRIINSGKLPEWHISSGSDSWIFIDEIKLDFE